MFPKMLARLLRRWKERDGVYQQALADIELVNSLPLEEAKQKAIAILSDAKKFRLKQASGHWDHPLAKQLGPATTGFFDAYESVEEIGREFSVSRNSVGASSVRNGFLKIGSDFESSDLLVRPGEDRVFIVTDAEHNLDDGFTTIYHSICLL